MNTLSNRFITAYNQIDDHLRSLNHENGKYIGFTTLVRRLARHHPLVEYYLADLEQFAQLRNSIVHESRPPDFIIAEPHLQVVEEIEQIQRDLTRPPLVSPDFDRPVVGFDASQTLLDLLAVMKAKNYTQFPIYKGQVFLGLLSTGCIAAWLAHHVQELDFKTSLTHILRHENRRNVAFLPHNGTYLDVYNLFASNPHLEAILITKEGLPDGPARGIITNWDLPQITHRLRR